MRRARPFLRRAVELGINFFDTANGYSGGSSEEILGRVLAEYARRDEVVIATKLYAPWRQGPNGGGLSRKAILTAIDDSLRRLRVDHVDLYQIHRWDRRTTIARGRLTRDPVASTERSSSDTFGTLLYSKAEHADRTVIERVAEVAEKRGVPRAQVALAWVAGAPGVTAPIVGATKPHHLEDAVAALDLDLDPEERALLEEPYVPHEVVGF